MSTWLVLLQTTMQRPAPDGLGPTSVVADDTYTLCRLLIVLAAGLSRWDIGAGEMVASLLDVNNAMGAALEVLGYRRGVKRQPGTRSIAQGIIKGTPGTKYGGVLFKGGGYTWQASPGEVGLAGYTLGAQVTATIDGSLVLSLLTKLTPSTTTTGLLSFEVMDMVTVGQTVEVVDTYRARVQQARSVRGGVEFAIEKRLREVSGVSAARAFCNRSAEEVDGIPGHHIESIVTGGSDLEVATCLRDIACSATAGFAGNRLVTLPHPQGSQVGSTDVRFSRNVDIRGWIRVQVKMSDAPVKYADPFLQGSLVRQIRVLAGQWSQTLGQGEIPLSSEMEAYIKDRMPKGVYTQMTASFSRDGFLYVNIIPLLRYESFRANPGESPAQAIGTKAEFYLGINPGDNLDISYLGGATQSVVFVGNEAFLSMVVDLINSAGWTGVSAAASNTGTLRLYTAETGFAVYFDILPSSSANLLDILGLFVNTYQGATTDIGMQVI
jgi:hypothetical protein